MIYCNSIQNIAMKALTFINELRSQGRFSFTTADAEKALALEKVPCLNALHRLKKNNLMACDCQYYGGT